MTKNAPYLKERQTHFKTYIKKLNFSEKQNDSENNPPRNEAFKPPSLSPINPVPFCEKSHAN